MLTGSHLQTTMRFMLHPYQFAIDEVNAKKIMEVYDYEYTDEEI